MLATSCAILALPWVGQLATPTLLDPPAPPAAATLTHRPSLLERIRGPRGEEVVLTHYTRLSTANDVFAPFLPYDDAGFTADLAADLHWLWSVGAVRHELVVDGLYRMITERLPDDEKFDRFDQGDRRWDELRFSVGYVRHQRRDALIFDTGVRAGLAAGGSFGGKGVQRATHIVLFTGRINTLPDTYVGEDRVAPTLGAELGVSYLLDGGPSRVQARLDAQVAPGDTGFTWIKPWLALTLIPDATGVHGFASMDIEYGFASTRDENLLIAGGYGDRGVSPGFTVGVRGSGWQAGWRVRFNEGFGNNGQSRIATAATGVLYLAMGDAL